MRTIATLSQMTGVAVVADWPADCEIPVLSGVQRQGDVTVVPRPVTATTPVLAAGVPVVRGESGGNTHTVYADAGAGVLCDPLTPTGGSLVVAHLVVPEGACAWLGHPEHGFLGIGAGSYEVRRQREMADELRMVAD